MLSTNYTENLLGIKDVIITDIKETDSEKHIYLDCMLKIQRCPHCFRETKRVHSFRNQVVKYVSIFGKHTYCKLQDLNAHFL